MNDKNNMKVTSSSAEQHNTNVNYDDDDDSDSDTNAVDDLEPGTLRVLSVGADCQMCVWDFPTESFIDADDDEYNEEDWKNSGSDGDTMMHDFDDYSEQHRHQRSSSVAIEGRKSLNSISREINFVGEDDSSPKTKIRDDHNGADAIVESMKRNETTRLLPVMAHKFHDRPITTVQTNEHGILTSCDSGKVKLWSRPTTKERYLTFVDENEEEEN